MMTSLDMPRKGERASVQQGRWSGVRANLDMVFIEGFAGQTVIGIDDDEQDVAQPVMIDLCIGVSRIDACVSDSIDDTINYASIHTRLGRLMEEHGLKLLEGLAGEIARIIICEFRAEWVRVRAAKPAKFTNVARVGVEIERCRDDFSAPDMAER
ncbi:dihydroneopterin aldolase [Xanthobacter sp. TB0139]|uniref:dihydroneopterin aldolase n=1 Tax=Xanthobacter sp. TB0139 TaxID=3459178 RepID=UPI00403A5B09